MARAPDARAFAAAVRGHVQNDVLIARIEQKDGTNEVLRRTAASIISSARPALAKLPGA